MKLTTQYIFKCLTLIGMLGIFAIPNTAIAKRKVSKIILDAGHGGKDGGCHGSFSNEKDITLAVCKIVGKMLQDSFKNDVKVAYTRTTDELAGGDYLSISQSLLYRTDFANREKGDLFISVHVNSTPRKNSPVKGTLVLVCGPTRIEEKEGAIGENSKNLDGNEEGLLDPNDPATAIIIAQYSQAFLSKSILLGSKINEEFENQGRKVEGVRQQSLQVLASSAMPGVLVEIGYLNNAEEENYLNTEEGLNEAALAIFKGIKFYKQEMEKTPVEVKIEN
ncbi:MAG TPA: N-acetylmuramoyl-L-alanine amidase [Chitinophagaceae bacterium]|nr:N-acetylmuramoyl-L-alanine amidase [Chitinophagaceae bacterium]